MWLSTIDQRRAPLLGAELLERGGDQLGVVGVADPGHVPAVAHEPGGDVVFVGQFGFAVDRDVVVVVDPAEVVEPEVAGDRAGFAGDALHQAAVAGDRVDVEVEDLGAVAGRLPLRGDRHPDRGRDSLPERSGRRLDARGPAVLGVARCPRVELAEAFDVLERDRRAARAPRSRDRRPGPRRGRAASRAASRRGPPRARSGRGWARSGRRGRSAGSAARACRRPGPSPSGCPGCPELGLLDRVDRERPDRVDAELVDVSLSHP